MKKLLTGILASTMILSSFSTSFAQEIQETTDFTGETAVMTDTLNSGTCGENAFWEYNSATKTLTITGTGVMEDYTFFGQAPWEDIKENVKTLVISPGITETGYYSFENFENLTSVSLPDTLTYIAPSSFIVCYGLTTITLPKNLEAIGGAAFRGCTALTHVTIPETVTFIGNDAFYGCESLKSIVIPDSVVKLGSDAFYSCYSLSSATVGKGVTVLPAKLFCRCYDLTTVNLSTSVTEIGFYTFMECTSLTTINIPVSVTKIDYTTFNGSTNLTTINYGGSYADKMKIDVKLDSPYEASKPLYNANWVNNYKDPFWEETPTTPEVTTPTTPEVTTPEVTTPEVTTPEVTTPEVTTPEVTTPEVTTPTIPDVQGVPDWAQVYVKYAISSGILPNISAYNMDSASNRGLIAQALYNYAGNGAFVPATHSFTDAGDYGAAIAWCYANGLMSGTSDTTFGTNSNVTREQFALILRALAKFEGRDVSGSTSTLSKFTDQNLMNDWAKEGIAWAVNAGLMEGNDGKLDPQGSVTQVQVSIMMQNFGK